MPDVSGEIMENKVWMSSPYQYYNIIEADIFNGIPLQFTRDTNLTIWGNNTNTTVTATAGSEWRIVGRDNSAYSNSNDLFIVKNPDGMYAAVRFDTDITNAPLKPDGEPCRDAADYLTNQYGGGIGFLSTDDYNAYNTFVMDSSARIKNDKDALLNNTPQGDVFTFENTKTSINEYIVAPINVTLPNNDTKNRIEPTIWSYGLPPQWTKYVDPRTTGFPTVDPVIKVGLGRRYAAVTISNPTILEIAPGFIKYSNWMAKDEGFNDAVDKLNNGGGDDAIQSLISTFDEHTGRFYTIKPCFVDQKYALNDSGDQKFMIGGYMSYVQYLMIIASIFLSREEIQRASGTTVISNDAQVLKFYSNGVPVYLPPLANRIVPLSMTSDDMKRSDGYSSGYTYKQKTWQTYNKHSGYLTIGGEVQGGKGVNLGAMSGASNGDTSSNAFETSFDYVKFYLSGSTNANDSFSTDIEESFLGNLANTLNMAMKESAYWLDSMVGDFASQLAAGAEEIVNSVKIGDESPLAGVFNFAEMMGGGKIVFPQIITSSKYGKSIQCECTFPAIYGDEEAMFINTLMPYLHLLAFVLPHQVKTSLEMYTFPFIVKAFCRGLFNVEMGAITSFNVSRGGSDNALWSFNGAAEIITVEFEITPLINNLVMTSTQDGAGWLLRNTGLQEYMSAITAFDARNDKFELGWDILSSAFSAEVTSKLSSIGSSILQSELVSSGIDAIRTFENINLTPLELLQQAGQSVTSGFRNAFTPPNTNINDFDATGQAQGLMGNNILGG